MIAVRKLNIKVGALKLTDISFEIPSGSYAVLMGRTGSGKTTILEAICGLRPIQSGTIHLHERDVTHLKPAERGIGFVPQEGALFTTMTVFEQLSFALRIRRWTGSQIQQRVQELVDLLGIAALLKRKPQKLSGGERQRVALGRALAFRPRVLCMDEPLSALDDETREEMYALLRTVRDQTGVTTLHITHSQSEASALADHLLVLRNGRMECTAMSAERS